MQLGQGNKLADHIGHAVGFLVDLVAKVLHGLLVAGVLEQGLGQQGNAADGGLELVGDVCHKVAAGGFHADVFALIGAVDDDKAAVVKRQRLNDRLELGDTVACAALGNSQVDGAGLLVLEDLLRGLPHVRVHGAIMHQGHLMGGGIGHDDFLVAV